MIGDGETVYSRKISDFAPLNGGTSVLSAVWIHMLTPYCSRVFSENIVILFPVEMQNWLQVDA